MTSAHRPTFDPVKGKAEQMRSKVTHARSLPSHTKMKYRRPTKAEDSEGKRYTPKEGGSQSDNENLGDNIEANSNRIAIKPSLEEENDNTDEESSNMGEQVVPADLASSQLQPNDSDSSSEYESESEDEETLLRELEKIKQERKEKKMEEIRTEMETAPQKRSWRNSTFRNKNSKKTTADKKSSYTNDTLQTEYHQKFMDKFIR